MLKHFATKGTIKDAQELIPPKSAISRYMGSIIASAGNTIRLITRVSKRLFPLNSNFASAYPQMEFTKRSRTMITST